MVEFEELFFRDSKEPGLDNVYRLIKAIDSLPGLKCLCNTKDRSRPIQVWFKVDTLLPESAQGLFFLTRCVDRRYFMHEWEISLSVGDIAPLPTHYLLSSKSIGPPADIEIVDLLHNMEYHLNQVNFINGFEIDRSKFNVVSKSDIRNEKIDAIL
jgi:hypothetical protein